MIDPGYTEHWENGAYGTRRLVRVWHDSVKMYRHWLDTNLYGDYEPVRALIKKRLRKAKREQKRREKNGNRN